MECIVSQSKDRMSHHQSESKPVILPTMDHVSVQLINEGK